MVSKNNQYWKQQQEAQRVPHYGLRKLSIGVASVLLSTTLYMGVTAHADTVTTPSEQPVVNQPTSAATDTSTGSITVETQPTANKTASVATNNAAQKNDASAQPDNATDTQSTAATNNGVQQAVNSNTPENDVSAKSVSTVLPKQPANATNGVQPFMNLAVESNNNDLASKQETVGTQWRIHYIDSTNRKHELSIPTLINMQYTRTNTPQSDGTIQHGDWSYVPGSFEQIGTQITVKDSDNPVKQDNIDRNGRNEDHFTVTAMYPTIEGYNFHDGINSVHLQDYLLNYDPNGIVQTPTMGKDVYVEYDPIDKRSVAIKFVDDQTVDWHSPDYRKQVGQAVTVTGRDGDTVNLKLTVPDKYQLADGQQLPTTYTFKKGSGDLTIHLKHQVVQREATVDVQLALVTIVPFGNNGEDHSVVTQAQWNQLDDELKSHAPGPQDILYPLVKVGTLTGHVGYDLVNENVVSFGNDWTTLNLDSRIYQLPNGTEVVNGIVAGYVESFGKKLKSVILADNPDVDPDYVNRPWHGYLSVNATNNSDDYMAEAVRREGLQSGLVGDEPNALAKATGDRAATEVEVRDKTIDLGWLQDNLFLSVQNFSEKNGQLRTDEFLAVMGVYIPYVEKAATRTINVVTPDGKTTTVEQTATLAKQVDLGKDAHPAWTTSEWESYNVPVIPGYTASQSNVDEVNVTSDTQSSEVNISYTANDQAIKINYVDSDNNGSVVKSDTLSGKTDQTVKTGITIPEGYTIEEQAPTDAPTDYTFKASGNADITVKLKHGTTTVTPDNPKTTGDKLPDNPSKNYPSGVAENDLNKTVTRTIKVTDPTGKVTTETQTVHLTRTATVDEVTGDVTYSDWSTGSFDSYDVPVIEGYTATQSKVDTAKVTSGTQNQTVDITYTATQVKETVNGSWTVKYTDKITGEEIMPSTTLHTQFTRTNTPATNTYGDWTYVPNSFSQTGTHVDVQDPIKENDITEGSDSMDTFKFSVHMPDDPNDRYQQIYNTYDVTFKLYNDNRQASTLDKTSIVPYKHKIINKETTIEIPLNYEFQIVLPDATRLIVAPTKDHLNGRRLDNVAYTVKQTVKGEAPYDKITGTFDYTKFSIGGEPFVIPGRILPQNIDNYYIVKAIDETTESNQYVGLTVQELLTKLQAHNYFALPTWDTYLPLASDDVDLTFVTKEEQGIIKAVAYNDLSIHSSMVMFDPNIGIETLAENDQPFVSFFYTITKEETKTVTRTIELQLPMKPTQTIKQTAILTRDQYQATNVPLYEDQWNKYTTAWHDSEWSAYTVPTVDGYTASQNEILVTKVTDTTKDQTIRVTYTANPQSIKINYVDDEKGGATVKSDTLNGKTDQTVKTGITNPENYNVVGTTPSEYTFKSSGNTDITVHLKHAIDTTSEEKTVTRTIKVTDLTGKVTTIPQTAKVTRTVSTDKVTNQKTYGDWTSSSFDSYDVPTIPGYTASQDNVKAVAVNGDTTDQTVNISYTANKQSVNVNYVDVNDGNKVVHTTTVSGVTDGDATVTNELPTGYKLVDGQSVPKTVHFNADNNDDINIKVQHSVVTVTPDSPKTPSDKLPDNPNKSYPSGVSENDLNKTITRTIKVAIPDGQTKTVEQAVHLTRTADVDEVTSEVTYGKWTTGEWANYDVPSVAGYTPSQNKVPTTKVTGDSKDQTVTVTYTADQQKLIVNFIDDTTGQTLKTVNKDGLTNSDSNYNTKSDIQDYVNNHYRLVSDDTNGQNLVFDHDDNKTQTYNVHLAHNTHNINDSKTITETIHYKLDNGQKAFDDYNAQLSFTRTGYNDEVTGQNHWNDWQATNGQTFNAVQSPSKEGYTPDKTSIEAVNVKPGDKNIDTTVTYNANAQAAKISYIDDTTGATLKTNNANGKFNQAISFDNNVDNQIKDYEQQGYVLKSNSFSNQMYQANNTKNVFEVHLIHGTKNVQRNDTINETVQYQMEDGTKAPVTNTQSTSFTQDGVQDLVTNNIDWKAIAPHQFKEVITPVMTGYTPDITSIPVITVNFGDKDISKIVTYKANAQTAKISYIDDNTGATLKTDNANGKFNQAISFGDVDGAIKGFEDKGYQLKSNSFKDQKYQADNNSNVFEVHLVHGTKNVQRTQKITETINYQMEDGTKAPATNSQSVDFTQDGVQDLVTNNIDWKATAPQQFKEVITPVMTGYTPDIASVPVTTVNFGDKNINKVVTYQANAQMAKISYIDDNTGATLKTDNANGKFNQAIDFANMNSDIKGFEDKGYQLKSNSFKDQKYQADNANNTFEVHFTHGTKNVQRQDTITETVNYQMDDGSEAPATNTQSVDFTQDGVQDLVTNNIDWKATEPQQFKAVDMPTLTGYTPDIANVPATTVNFGDKDINKLVTYKANAQNATINYIDDTTGKTIKTDNANGKFNQPISFDNNVDNQIKAFENQGYVLKSNSFNGQKYQADNDSNVFEVHLVHGTKDVQRTQKITETVNYQMDDGSQAPSTNTQSVNFTQNGVQDLVTNNIDWKATDPQQFKAVDSPALTGYTPDIASVPVTTVNFGDKDINKTVTYKANPQSAKITYIDDNTGKALKVDDANGKFNQVIDFANMNGDIKDFANQGYVLKSNSFNGQNYQADNANNTFEVHFTHGTKNVQRQDTITETVKYQYDNGTPAHENNVQTLNFTQDGVQDLVTKNIDWKPTDAQEFKQVDTPAIDGYTPDITLIAATKVNFGDGDINKAVTYQANNQTANIYYVDDMTDSFIGNDTANGEFGTVIDFGNVNDKINTFKDLGYQLVSNGFNGQTYQSDNSKNIYYVHFTHGIKNIQRNKQITETIKYQYENGQQAQPDSVQTVSFNENGSRDLVTKKINWFNDAPQQFKAVNIPVITGYTADIDNIPAVVVGYDNDNINKVVTYKANSQTAKINYIDDTTGKVIKTDTANGKFNQAISFSETPTNVVNDLIKRGYKLVSNSFNGQTYQNDNSKNEFTVHLAHNTKNVSKQNTVTRTINYLDNDGKAIQTPTVETVTFTQNGITDLVTGNTTWNTPSSQTFETVTSPTIKGFSKPDVEVVQPQTVNFNDQNVVVNVHYPKATTPTNVNNNTTTPTVDHNKGKLNPITFTTTAHQTTPQAHTANNGGQQSITPQSINKPSEQQTVANNSTKANTLPQTGNSRNNGTAIVGLGLLSGMLGLLGIKGKKKQD